MGMYSIHVLEYAYISEYPRSSIVYGNHNAGTEKLPYGYVLIQGNGVCAMVDVGFNHADYGLEMAKAYSVENWRPPQQVLAECGVTPDDVTHVFLTHAHFDHMGGIDLFPNANFYIQKEELSKWVWMLSLDKKFRWLLSGIDPADILRVVDLARNGRLVSVDGAMEDVLPGIDLLPAYKSHTPGSQYVVVRNDGVRNSQDAWALVGDLVYKYENLLGADPLEPEYRPVGYAQGNQINILMAYERIMQMVGGDHTRVVPVHESRLREVFPFRISEHGLAVIEVALEDGATSFVN
ncbi:N-acyl homoserine lactonase family protein [Burkholderia sp. Ax-1719]|uniref:N-acyl homoserine lactonase family protein n=1 Tax=Burkholderia sp. Ax-1719 TaxID=2608334 RepID=UPI001422A0E2|nr:N-acyl homoserine lactonase family protein [Burkholderia sp. Ax-1719]NIE63108.1 N-acyl homoserine lactonase family protein [Burkholderia sp. Ax-1719]